MQTDYSVMSASEMKAGRLRPLAAAVRPVLVGLLACLGVSIGLNVGLLYVPSLTAFDRTAAASLALPLLIGLPLLAWAALLARKVGDLRNRLNRLTVQDGTTALLRPESFAAFVDRRAPRGSRSEPGGALLVIQLENFRSIQLQFGFAWAASMERAAADCIRASVRSGDPVGGFGHGQFAIFLPGATEDNALDVGKRVIGEIEKAHLGRSDEDNPMAARVAGVWFKRDLPLEKIFSAALQELEHATGGTALALAPAEAYLSEYRPAPESRH